MPNNNKKRKRNAPRRFRRRVRRRTSGPATGANQKFASVAELIRNPCKASLDHTGFSADGTGILFRVKTGYSLHSVGADSHGYIVAFPEYHGTASSPGVNASVYSYEDATTSTNPVNTTADPYGSGTVSGTFHNDPAHAPMEGSAISSGRTVSACLSFEYTGPLLSMSGRVGALPNIGIKQTINRDFTAGMDVGEALAMCPYTKPTAKERFEVIWRPRNSVPYRTSGRHNGVPITDSSDTCYEFGVAATSASLLAARNPDSVNGIGFAWTGLPSTETGDIYVELVKVIEVKMDYGFGVTVGARVPRALPTADVDDVVGAMDQTDDEWQIVTAAKAAYNHQGVRNFVAGAAKFYLRNQGSPAARLLHDEL